MMKIRSSVTALITLTAYIMLIFDFADRLFIVNLAWKIPQAIILKCMCNYLTATKTYEIMPEK